MILERVRQDLARKSAPDLLDVALAVELARMHLNNRGVFLSYQDGSTSTDIPSMILEGVRQNLAPKVPADILDVTLLRIS